MKFIYEETVNPDIKLVWTKKVRVGTEYHCFGEHLFFRWKSQIFCISLDTGDEKWSKELKGLQSFHVLENFILFQSKKTLFRLCLTTLEVVEIGPLSKFLLVKGIYNNFLINSYCIYDFENNQIINDNSIAWKHTSGSKAYSKNISDSFLFGFDIDTRKEFQLTCPTKILSYVNSDNFYFRDKEKISICQLSESSEITEIANIKLQLNTFTDKFIGGVVDASSYVIHSNENGKMLLQTKLYEKCFFSGEKYLWAYDSENIDCIEISTNELLKRIPRDKQYLATIGSGFILFKSTKEDEVFCYRNTLLSW